MKVNNSMFALGATALATLAKAETLDLAWGMNLQTGEEILTISREGEVLASACNNIMQIGKLGIKVDSDATAHGKVTIGDTTYDLGESALCSANWNQKFVEAACQLPFQDNVDFSLAPTINGTYNCFVANAEPEDPFPLLNTDGVAEILVEDAEVDAGADPAEVDITTNPLNPHEMGLDVRQNCGGVRFDRKESNPKRPHKYRGWKQITPALNCDQGTCTISHSQSRTVTHQFTISAGGSYMTAGYSVTKSTSSTTTFGCNAKRGERVCVRNMRPYQQYVITERINACGSGWSNPKDYSIRAPMKNTNIGGWYCSRGTADCKVEAGYKGYGNAGSGRW